MAGAVQGLDQGSRDVATERAAPATASPPEQGRPASLLHTIRPSDAEIERARRRLHAKALGIAVVAVASYVVLVFAPVTLVFRAVSGAVLVVSLVALATNVMHDANHGAFSRSRRLNRMLSYTLDVLGGSSWLWRYRHNVQHHGSTNVVGIDGDIDHTPLARLAPQQQWRPWHRYQHLYLWPLYGLLVVRWFLITDFVALSRNRTGLARHDPRWRRQFAILIGGKLVHLSWAILVPLALHPWWAVAGVYLLGSWIAGTLLALVFQIAHCVEEAEFASPQQAHRGQHFQRHQLETTFNVRCRTPGVRHIMGFLFGGLDRQIEHHLAPTLPHTIYPLLGRRLETECLARALPYRYHDGVRAALRSHLRWLKVMGANPTGPAATR